MKRLSLPQRPPLRRVNKKALVLLALHACIFAVVFWFAFFIRHDFSIDAAQARVSLRTLWGWWRSRR